MLKAEREVRCNEDYLKKIVELEAQIEKMKNDVISNRNYAMYNKNEQMEAKMNSMLNQWERIFESMNYMKYDSVFQNSRFYE